MKKWLIPIIAVLLCAALALGIVLLTRDPFTLRALKNDIRTKGYASEETGEKILSLSENTKARQTENGAVQIYRIVNNQADGYVCLVNIFLTEDSIAQSAYEWTAIMERTSEASTYHAKGKIQASAFSPEKKDIGFTFTYQSSEPSALLQYYIEAAVFEALYGSVTDLDKYLAKTDTGLTAMDYGFIELYGKSKE